MEDSIVGGRGVRGGTEVGLVCRTSKENRMTWLRAVQLIREWNRSRSKLGLRRVIDEC